MAAAHSFSSLRDMLSSPSPPKPKSVELISSSSSWRDKEPQELNKVAYVADGFGGLSLEESPLSSLFCFDTPLSLPTSFSSSSRTNLSLQTNTEKKKGNHPSRSLYGKNDEKEEGNMKHSTAENVDFGRPRTSGRLFPPPISCLKLCKTGKPYVYFKCNKDEDSFDLEEVRIPAQDILCASREDGRLKLYFVLLDGEISENEEEVEVEGK